MVIGLPKVDIPEKACAGCLISKHSKNSFKSYLPMRSNDLLEVVHSDVCGPFEVPSLGGNKYFVSFVDEFSRMMWLFFIKTKGEVFQFFKGSKLWLRSKVESSSRCLEQMVEENTPQMSLRISVLLMAFNMRLQHLTPLNTMGWLRGEIE